MRLYIRYLSLYNAYPLAGITLTLTGIIWLTQSLRYVDLIVNRGVSIGKFVTIAALLLPALLYIILPIAIFCAVLFAYQRLIMDSELVILQGAGLSRFDLARPVLLLAGIVMLISYSLSLYFLPLSYRAFKDTQAFIRNHSMAVLLQEGVFTSIGDGMTVYIDQRGSNERMRGILVHDQRNPNEQVTMMAEEGIFRATKEGPRLDLFKGSRQVLDRKIGAINILYFDNYNMDISLYTSALNSRARESEERYLHELLWPEKEVSPSDRQKFWAEAHHRITWPLLSLVLPMLAVTGLLRSEFNRRGLYKRIINSAVAAIVILSIDLGLKHMTAIAPWCAIFMYANVLIVFLVLLIQLTHYPEYKYLPQKEL
jgi:lipopolysaccharide export system permease protein